jgi:hypothetical protein
LIGRVEAINYPWIQFYDFSRKETLNAGVECRDEGFALVGSYFIRTDHRDNVLWSRIYEFGEITDIVKCYDGGFMMLMGGQVVRTDANGNVLWNHSSGIGGVWNQISNFALYSSGGYAFVGSPTTSYSSDPCLVYVTEGGEVLWNYKLGIVSDWYTIVECSNKGFTWTCEVGENQPYPNGTYLVHTSSSRIEEWSFRLHENVTYTDAYLFGRKENESLTLADFIWVSSGGFALLGKRWNESDIILIRTDSLGNQLWNQSCDVGLSNEYPKVLIECSNGGFAFCGVLNYVFQYGPIFVGRVSTDGTYNWTFKYSSFARWSQNSKRILSTRENMNNKFGYTQEFANDLFEVSDGGFAIVGKAGGSSSDAFFMRIPDMDPGEYVFRPPERPPRDFHYTVVLPLTELLMASTVVILVWAIIMTGFYLQRKQQERAEGESDN